MRISVVIPCRNEVNYIKECIEAIYTNEFPRSTDLSVFVVDGMSDDGTREILLDLKEKYASLVVVDNIKQLTPYAFNLGIYAGGKADYVQIIGARHIISPTYIKEAVEIIQKKKEVWCVGGEIINEYVNHKGEIISKAMSTAFGMGLGNFRTLKKSGFTDTVTSPMYPYSVFEKIGFFDEDLIRNQDDDFNYRVSQAGAKIYFNKNVSLKYYVRGNFPGLWRQFYQYGYWKVFVNRKHQAVTTYRQLIPPAFVTYLILMLISSVFGIKVVALLSVPFIFYLLLNFYFSVKSAKSLIDFVQLVITYSILHTSYGLGYLKGIIDFFILKKEPGENQKRMSR